MRYSTLVIAIAALVVGHLAFAETPLKHDFARLQRLSEALYNFNYPERGTNSITVWLQGGGKGVSAGTDKDALDLTNAIKLWDNAAIDGLDLANVAVLQADGRSIRFVDMQEFAKSGKPSGITVKRGDLVALLKNND